MNAVAEGERALRDRLSVVLVEPQYPGNVGFVARAMMNFGVTRLVIVGGCAITEEARTRAVHAQRVLDEAVRVDAWPDAYDRFDHLAAFSARVSAADRSHLRNPVSLEEAAPVLRAIEGELALVFGREDDGLRNDEVEAADVVLQIPTSPLYASMNLSHAVAVALYEVFRGSERVHRLASASHMEKELIYRYSAALYRALRLPPHRQDNTLTAFRRVLGRSGLSKWEYHRLMGVVSATLKRLGEWPVDDLPLLPPDDDGAPPSSAD